jgi:hypothetical protein
MGERGLISFLGIGFQELRCHLFVTFIVWYFRSWCLIVVFSPNVKAAKETDTKLVPVTLLDICRAK